MFHISAHFHPHKGSKNKNMSTDKFKLVVGTLLVAFVASIAADDLPCAARQIYNRSVICVCDPTYCDTITRTVPAAGEFVTYVSTEAGQRFNKTTSAMNAYVEPAQCSLTLDLHPSTVYQTIKGFGGAVTDSAAINWNGITDETLKQYLIDSYASSNGLEYNMLRVPIGGSDCSARAYAYNELPVNDTALSNFTLTYEDLDYKIPMIKALMNVSTAEINLFGSLWSPPKWMKTNNEWNGVSYLKTEYYQTLADYYLKFIQAYKENGLTFWGVTTGNEPLTSIIALSNINSLGWTVTGLGNWVINNLAPTLKGYDSNLQILGVDDNRHATLMWFNNIVNKLSDFANTIDGIAVHYYNDDIAHPSLLTKPIEKYPHLYVISTEASNGIRKEVDVDLGSWDRGVKYANDIIEDLTYNVTGWVDWNMCLDEVGGPTWIGSYLDSPIIVPSNETAFYKQPMYYALGHFTKFLPRGSQRIRTVDSSSALKHVAVLTPDNTIVVVFLNEEDAEKELTINLGDEQACVVLQPKSFTTVELSYSSTDVASLDVEYNRSTCNC